MAQSSLKYYATSAQPHDIIEVRDGLAQSTAPQALLAAAYAKAKALGVDFWAAAAIDHPSHYVWFHTRLPLSDEILHQQTADLNRQATLSRSEYVQLPIMIFEPNPMAATEHPTAPAVETAPVEHRDFHIWSAHSPRTLVRVGCCEPTPGLDYNLAQGWAELVGLHLSSILYCPDSLEALEILGAGEKLDEETFFQCVELALAEVNRRDGELTLLVMEMKPRDEAAARRISSEDWHRVWEVIRGQLRRTDLVGQLKSGRYVLAMPLTDCHDAMIVADRIRTQVEALADQGLVPIDATMGMSTWNTGRPGVGRLLWEAREAMQLALQSNSGSLFIYA